VTLFVDTSGLVAVMNSQDPRHDRAVVLWEGIVRAVADGGENAATTNYVLVETLAVVQRQLGMQAAQALIEDAFSLLNVHWVDEHDHAAGLAAFIAAGQRRLSLVDTVSFVVMRRLAISRAFAFDGDFRRQGFETL
jgi:predicted nucleic acid-binding protein